MSHVIRLLVLSSLLPLAGPVLAADSPGSYLLQTVLLHGSKEGTTDLDGVPPNVVAALEDVAKFLPYKSYRLVDVALIRSSGNGQGLLSGSDGRQFDLGIRFEEGDAGKLEFEAFELDSLVAVPNDKVTVEDGKSKVEHTPTSWVRRRVISSDFSIAVGETIVVGSSKLNGTGDALIVLFTALR